MDQLSNELLIDTYIKAVRLNLDEDFISIIKQEMRRRDLEEPSINQDHNNTTQNDRGGFSQIAYT